MSKEFEYDPESGSFRFDEGGKTPKKKDGGDIGSWIMESKSAIEDADEMNVDQAYRLTLLELNVSDTDDTENT